MLEAFMYRGLPSQLFLENAANMDLVQHRYRPGRLSDYRIYEAYYHGEQNTKVLDRARMYIQASGFRWCENLCDIAVNAAANRMILNGTHVTAAGADRDDLKQVLDDAWDANKGDMLQGTVHTETKKLGDGFLIVGFDQLTMLPTYDFNPADQVKVVYSSDNVHRKVYASKVWRSHEESPLNPSGKEIRRMNIYWPDRIEKYYNPSTDGDWHPFLDMDDTVQLPAGPNGEIATSPVWPLPWTLDNTPFGLPRGIPVFHFANKRQKFMYGLSDLHKAVPMQDAFNKHVLDVFEIADHMAWPQRWATGVNRREQGSLDTTPASVWTAGADNAKFGQFPAADMSNALAMLESDLQRFAALTETPLFALLMNGQWPSGEALRTAEAPLVSRIVREQPSFGAEWEAAQLYGLGLYSTAMGLALPAGLKCHADWRDPFTRGQQEQMQFVEGLVRLGLSAETALTMVGIEDAGIELEKTAIQKQAEADARVASMAKGLLPGM